MILASLTGFFVGLLTGGVCVYLYIAPILHYVEDLNIMLDEKDLL